MKKIVKLSELAELLKGTLSGQDITVSGFSTAEAQNPNEICVVSGKNVDTLIQGAAPSYVIAADYKGTVNKPHIRVAKTRYAFLQLLNYFMPEKEFSPYISDRASIDETAVLGENVSVGAFVVIEKNAVIGSNTRIGANCVIGEDVQIGAGSIIYPNVTLYDGVKLGERVIIHSGVVIGADGFGFIPAENHIKIPHKGTVLIDDDVEIGANTAVDKGTLGNTVIGQGTKIDNLCQIAHNVRLGRGCLVAALTAFGGSSIVGDYVIIGGQVGVGDHVNIGSFTSFAAKTGIHNNIPEKSGAYGGVPSVPIRLWAKQSAAIARLPELRKKVMSIHKTLNIKEDTDD